MPEAVGYNVANVVLPSVFGSPGEALQQEIALKERRDERDYQRNQQNRLSNLRQINDLTDFDQYKTGDRALDAYSQKELSKLFDNAVTNYVNLDPAESQFRLRRDMQDFVKWDMTAKAKNEEIKTKLADFNKTYPNVDFEKAHRMAYTNFATDFLDTNGNRKDPSFINLDRDYVNELHNPENLGQLVNDVSPFADYIQSFKGQKIGASEYTNKQGNVKKYKYTGELTPFSELQTDTEGKPTGVKLKSEQLQLDGGMLDMLPEEQFNQMMQIPKVRASVIGLWNQAKGEIEQKMGKKISPAAEDKLMRNYLYNKIKKENLDTGFFKTEEVEKTPIVKNYIGTGGKQSQPFNQETSGVEFDRIGTVDDVALKSGGKISKGIATDKNGNPYNGEAVIKRDEIPATFINVLKTNRYKDEDIPDLFNIRIENGRIEAVKPEGGEWIDRQDMYNFQLQNNTEPIKAPQKIYGKKQTKEENKSGTKIEDLRKKYNY